MSGILLASLPIEGAFLTALHHLCHTGSADNLFPFFLAGVSAEEQVLGGSRLEHGYERGSKAPYEKRERCEN
jgi:hypothetical protein